MGGVMKRIIGTIQRIVDASLLEPNGKYLTHEILSTFDRSYHDYQLKADYSNIKWSGHVLLCWEDFRTFHNVSGCWYSGSLQRTFERSSCPFRLLLGTMKSTLYPNPLSLAAIGQLKKKLKVQTVLKSTKLLHEHTIYLLIYVHACILRASWCKKARNCERTFDIFLVVIGIKDVWKMEPSWHIAWMSQNLNSIFFLWMDLTYKCFVRTAFFSYYNNFCTN